MSSALVHTSVYHLAKSTSISVICSTCFLSAIVYLNPLRIKFTAYCMRKRVKSQVWGPIFLLLGSNGRPPTRIFCIKSRKLAL